VDSVDTDRAALLEATDDGTFEVFVPVTPLVKAAGEGAGGAPTTRDGTPVPKRLLEGIASSESKDQQGEVIIQAGIDFRPLLEKGFINWNHSHAPKDQIGQPLEAVVLNQGPTDIPALFLRGFLYEDHRGADEAWELLVAMEKARRAGHGRRQMGWSVEGGVVLRDGKTLARSIVRHMALTHEPVNTDTYAKAALAKSHGFELDDAVWVEDDGARPHLVFGGFEALCKSLAPSAADVTAALLHGALEKTVATGLTGTGGRPAATGGQGEANALRLENLSPRLTRVLPEAAACLALCGPCKPGRTCPRHGRVVKGLRTAFEHLVHCYGQDPDEVVERLSALRRAFD
jgi:hypothetical protein